MPNDHLQRGKNPTPPPIGGTRMHGLQAMHGTQQHGQYRNHGEALELGPWVWVTPKLLEGAEGWPPPGQGTETTARR